MRSKTLVAFVAGLLALQIGEACALQNPPRLTDPMFGLSYTPRAVTYEPIPSTARSACRGFSQGRAWVFARLHSGDADYMVLMGITSAQDGDALGSVVKIRGNVCQAQDSTWFFSGTLPPANPLASAPSTGFPGLNEKSICEGGADDNCHYMLRAAGDAAVLRALARDALARGEQAWGAAAFHRAVCAPERRAADASTPILAQEVASYCKAK